MGDSTTTGRHHERYFFSRGAGVWVRIALTAIAAVPIVPATALSQTCEDDNAPHAVALIERLQSYCEDASVPYPYTFDLYALASVAGKDAIPALRKIAAWPHDTAAAGRCGQWVTASRDMLAKLGDENARTLLDAEFGKPETAYTALASLSFVGDDRALLALIHYLIDHADDPAMIQDFGDYSMDSREELLLEIDSIRRRRIVPGLPTADYSPGGIAQWKDYLAKYEGQKLTFPVYPNVSDPYLQCLARRVEWGYPDAILAIAASGNSSAASILRHFPQLTQNSPMGFAEFSPFSNLRHWSLIQGNLEVALAQLGDQEMFDRIVYQLGGAYAYESVRKLEFLGGKPAIDALVNALSVPDGVVEKARQKACGQTIYCNGEGNSAWKPIWTVTPTAVEIDRETCLAERYYHACLIGVLALMVQNPPLPSTAAATPENIQKWKDWWIANKDHAVLVQKPVRSFE
jgi:hypothetical protein